MAVLFAQNPSSWQLYVWLMMSAIGLFALVGFSYNYKFLWSPFIDRVPIPFLTSRLGRLWVRALCHRIQRGGT